jgi:hypothetical protein
MISSDAIRYAMDFCSRYPDHNLVTFLKNDINCVTEFIAPFLLVQYRIDNNTRIVYSMFFDTKLWDRTPSSSRIIKAWFKLYDNQYACNLTNTASLRKYVMRLA